MKDAPEKQADDSAQTVKVWLLWAVLIALIALVWSNGLHGEFTYDDKLEVVGNRTIRMLSEWGVVASYNPARVFVIGSYAINYHYAGADPFLYHMVDVAIHMVCAGLAMLFVSTLARSIGVANHLRVGFVSALLWSLHPLTTEAVTYTTGRSEQLVALFGLWACWLWTRWLVERERSLWITAWLGVALACLCKENAVVIPAVFLVIDIALSSRQTTKGRPSILRRTAPYLPGLFMLIFAFGLRLKLHGVLTTPTPMRDLLSQVMTEAIVTWRYLFLSVLPIGQTVFHDQAEVGVTPLSLLALVGMLSVVAFAVVRRSRNLFLSVAVGWFLLFLAPTFIVPLKETMAEHRAFIGLLGVAWSVAWLLELLGNRPRQVVTFVIVAALGLATVQRNSVWSTEVTLWEEATQRSPESAEAWYGFGEAQRYTLANPELPEAEADRLNPVSAFSRAVELDPEYKEAWNKLGISQAELGNTDVAIQAWQEALRIDPQYCKPHTNWGKALAQMGRNVESLEEFQSALTWCPDNATAHYFAGLLFDQRMNDVEKARFHYETLLEIEPTFGCPFGLAGGQCVAEEVRQRILELTW